jgi:hypothetical protein
MGFVGLASGDNDYFHDSLQSIPFVDSHLLVPGWKQATGEANGFTV